MPMDITSGAICRERDGTHPSYWGMIESVACSQHQPKYWNYRPPRGDGRSPHDSAPQVCQSASCYLVDARTKANIGGAEPVAIRRLLRLCILRDSESLKSSTFVPLYLCTMGLRLALRSPVHICPFFDPLIVGFLAVFLVHGCR